MYINSKESDAIYAAIDFITTNAEGADELIYPHDILDGLHSILNKYKGERKQKHFKQLVNKELKN